jgi:hypothetical protein
MMRWISVGSERSVGRGGVIFVVVVAIFSEDILVELLSDVALWESLKYCRGIFIDINSKGGRTRDFQFSEVEG